MDFDLDETQQDLRKLAAEVLARDGEARGGEVPATHGGARDGERLRQAGLMSVCAPEEAGGAGLGPVELAVVLREVGARAASVPLLPTLVGTLTLARHGTPEQQRGEVAVAIREPGAALADPPRTTARLLDPPRTTERLLDAGAATVGSQGAPGETAHPGGWALSGRKVGVVHPAPAVLVTAAEGLFLTESPPTTPEYTSTGEPAATVVLDGTPAERIAGPEAVADAGRLFMAAVAAQASGVLAGALELTTGHIRTRKQFGRALAEFQAVTVQIADVYIAARALDVAMWSAVWRLGEGLPADRDLALAAYHAVQGVQALHTCQHLHGGLGLDVTYPLHRYFAQAKHLSHLLGGTDAQLDLIGALL
ncbi:acyl-CoA dehydrogenase [Nonomuraea phyllanthi]|uniref:Acyl-CoA dehydrogenase n=1 Tax=Nonomuraea phyllanthi TaxID=2219224 RepID=A0A5C4WFF3_9ACTN|nr:acyl-CoA dehydrogenase family protein [Nonomuraea phyllanthi]KAB8193741.1 acyl-CoA dehydrogenase [Nonomuraea phyllanthi]